MKINPNLLINLLKNFAQWLTSREIKNNKQTKNFSTIILQTIEKQLTN